MAAYEHVRVPKSKSTGAKRGRPCKYSLEVMDRARALLAEGHTMSGVASQLRVHRSTLRHWRKAQK